LDWVQNLQKETPVKADRINPASAAEDPEMEAALIVALRVVAVDAEDAGATADNPHSPEITINL
jgi:hypothetical protein